jgi:very-short-patch-repair endonuclease
MGATNVQESVFWSLVASQHGVVTRAQLLGLGFTPKAIKHAVATRRLHPIHRGVYAAGRPDLSAEGRWLAGVLVCGEHAVLSHGSAATLWGMGEYERGQVEVSVPSHVNRRQPQIRVRRRMHLGPSDVARRSGIPVTTPSRTLIDLAPRLGRHRLERLVNDAANLDLVTPAEVRAALDQRRGQAGVSRLAAILDRRTFRLTRSHLERLFLPLVEKAGLPAPETMVHLNGFEVDFYWPDLDLVVETDGLRFHRTPAQQARDRLRDQVHTAAGLTSLRFTHEQVRYEPAHVRRTLAAVAARARARGNP